MTTKTRTLKSTRGNIYDRNGQVLASNELSYSITLEDSGDYANNTEKKLQNPINFKIISGFLFSIKKAFIATEG